ncbi:xylulose kinase, partial [Mycobacterium sp. ITM-2017-0098]
AGQTPHGAVLGPGAGDNASAALGLSAGAGDCVVSLGTSGVVSAVGDVAPHDAEGIVAGFADATGRQLPLVCTLNGAPVLAAVAAMLRVDFDELDRLALSAPAGADGLTLVPYFEGERSPNLPDATGALHGVTVRNLNSAN